MASAGACGGGVGGDDEGAASASAFAMGVVVASGRIGATGAGPGTGGIKGCLGSVCGGAGLAVGLRKAPAALTSSKILLLVGVTGVVCCTVPVFVDAALGAALVSFLPL